MAKRTKKQIEKLIEQIETIIKLEQLKIDALEHELIDLEIKKDGPFIHPPVHKLPH